jgi:ABC-type phosphate/phosphonate transport system substrate-binding protein
LKVVARQGPVPTHVMAVRAALDGALVERLERLLLTMSADQPELTEQLFGGPLLRVDADAHLAPIERALAFVRELR